MPDVLQKISLPEIDGVQNLAQQIRISPSLLYGVAFTPRYKARQIKKKSSGFRTIHIPPEPLKAVQRWLVYNVLDLVPVDKHATAYVPGQSPIRANVEPHVGKEFLMCLDFENFFPSIGSDRIRQVFYSLNYSGKGLHLLTALCTLNGKLPVGAPTSPALSNLVCRTLDDRIANYVERRGVTYTRYGDDLTFSALKPQSLDRVLPMIRQIVEDEGFKENHNKYRRMGPSRKRTITGIILANGNSYGIGTKQFRILRSRVWNNKGSQDPYLEGMKAWIRNIDSAHYHALVNYEAYVKSLVHARESVE